MPLTERLNNARCGAGSFLLLFFSYPRPCRACNRFLAANRPKNIKTQDLRLRFYTRKKKSSLIGTFSRIGRIRVPRGAASLV
ncbi:MAG TPA: hypothetical protein H9832_03490, partial [Candidatus Agathobaculum merdavium]|nr:hypothetical protein [Candidatus Agathobaculum merdavium]